MARADLAGRVGSIVHVDDRCIRTLQSAHAVDDDWASTWIIHLSAQLLYLSEHSSTAETGTVHSAAYNNARSARLANRRLPCVR